MAQGDRAGGLVDGAGRATSRWRSPTAPGLAAVLVALTIVSGFVVVGATTTSAAETGAVAAPPAADCGPRWVTAWQTSPQAEEPESALGGRTLRMVVQPRADGSQASIRLSNRFGREPLVVGPVTVARSAGGAAVEAETFRAVRFRGEDTVAVPPGEEVRSDPVPLDVESGRALAVSAFVPEEPAVVAGHPVALQTSYVSRPGRFADRADAAPFETPVASWLVVTRVDVLAPRPVGAIVAVGDSITDGVGSHVDADERWPDALATRLTAGDARLSVLNAGISANQLLRNRPGGGDSPLSRFDADVAEATGVTDVVLHIGTNDVAAGRDADEIVAGLVRFTDLARARGKRVFLTTITPADRGPHGTADAIATREAVNRWVREQGRRHADGVFDFAAAVADPADPTRLAPRFDSGDGLHLSAAGYRALADAVEIERFAPVSAQRC